MGVLKVACTEAKKCSRSLLFWWLLVIAPLSGLIILYGLFGQGMLRELPCAVVDQDQSTLSRSLIRQLDALSCVDISHQYVSAEEARRALQRGEIYGAFIVPLHFESDILRKRSPRLEVWVDGQHMPVGSTMRRDITNLGSEFWSGLYIDLLEKRGMTPDKAQEQAAAVGIDLRSATNGAVSYRVYMPHAFFPVLFQLTLMIWICFQLHRAREAGQMEMTELIGCILPGMVWAWIGCCLTGGILVHSGDLPSAGGFGTLCAVYALFILACSSLGFLLAGTGDELLQSLVLTSALASPAFAFSGVSFPIEYMPTFARMWSCMIPISHSMNLEAALVQLNAPIQTQSGSILALCLQIACYGSVGALLHIMRKHRQTVHQYANSHA